MPDEKTRGDSLRFYHTGAANDGDAQTSANASLGTHRSSTEKSFLTVSSGALTNVTIARVAGANLAGSGTLEVNAAADSVRWTAPSGTAGDWVAISSGQTKVCESGSAPEKFVRVTCSGALTSEQSATIVLAEQYNNAIGLDNVSSAEASAGDSEYRCIAVKNDATAAIAALLVWLGQIGTATTSNGGYSASGAVTINTAGSLATWPTSGFVKNTTTGEVMYYSAKASDTSLTVPAAGRDIYTDVAGGAAGNNGDALVNISGIRIGKEAPNAQPDGHFATIAGEGSAPAGVTFYHPTSSGDANVINIGALAAGEIYAIWIHRKVAAATVALSQIADVLKHSFEAI